MVSTRRFFIVALMGLNVVHTIALGLTSNGSSRADATTAAALDSFSFSHNGYFLYDWIEGATTVAAPSCENCAQRCVDFGDACIAFNTNADCAAAGQCSIYTTQYGTGASYSASHCRAYNRVSFGTTSPTPSPTAAPANAAATGDPHLQNVNGDRFDLMKPGNHVLVNIPRGERAEKALLRVEAEASKLGGLCEDIYFTDLNVTGSWAYAKQARGYHFASQGSGSETSKWIALGAVEFKVVHAHTTTGTQYLNFYIKHLGRAGFGVGGLLGEDDHVVESTPSAACVQHMQLNKLSLPLYSGSSAVSIAQGTFA